MSNVPGHECRAGKDMKYERGKTSFAIISVDEEEITPSETYLRAANSYQQHKARLKKNVLHLDRSFLLHFTHVAVTSRTRAAVC